MFDSLIANVEISKATDGKWDTVKFYSDRWYFAKYDEEEDSESIFNKVFGNVGGKDG